MVHSLVETYLGIDEGQREVGFAEQLLSEEKHSPLVPVAEARELNLIGVNYPGGADLAVRTGQTCGRRDVRIDVDEA